mmetsp:Transcript_62908/g.99867  ORF Transcript_62908/g.99867 Transcript_62908/m.99867 type:complete len:611 (+) Transcript_62908:92-1924(+)
MIDAIFIFTKGGLLLWSKMLVKIKGDPLDKLIKEKLLEEHVGESQATIDLYNVKWLLKSEFDMFFVAVYQGIVQMTYLDALLTDCAKVFLKKVSNGVSLDLRPPYTVDFDDEWKKVLEKADKEHKDRRRNPVQMKSFAETDKGKKILDGKDDVGNEQKKKKGGGAKGDDAEEDDEESAGNSAGDDSAGDTARKKGPGKFVPKSKKTADAKPTEENGKKKGKEARSWDGQTKVTAKMMDSLDRSATKGAENDDDIGMFKEQFLPSADDEPMPDDVSSIDAESENEDDEKQDEGKAGRVGGLFKSLTKSVKNLTGGADMTEEDLAPILKSFKTSLMSKNVAADVADKLADSVRHSLLGKRTDRFTSMAATVKAVLQDAIETQLTPKKSIDVLRAALAAKNAGRVYSIVFLGVNGVGKSTNLAKVAYYLKHKGGLNVLICACDTFRAGAVEQLKTHSRCLDVPLFERGYGKDPAEIAKHAIAHAQSNGMDVVLVDTAGRMQDNEPLMRALAKLVAVNNPDLVLFVGEALVGNDAIDQVTKFNRSLIDMSHDPRNPRGIDGMLLTKYDTVDDKVGAALSMVYVTGQPIVFVGCGQKYTHLRKMHAKEVVKTLLG